MSARTSKVFARTRKNLPKGLPWLVEEIEYHDGVAIAARVACYCFDRTWAKRIAKALRAPKQTPAAATTSNGLVQTSFLETEETCSGLVS
jgi:hypothetical protein